MQRTGGCTHDVVASAQIKHVVGLAERLYKEKREPGFLICVSIMYK